mmetsp:Transcript_39524/g.37997  ORF Transcript_39524/g.37997 Transcript_39524/m.37997 type:complete len:80 (+) Transcript_39524:676-915(+)
MQTQKKGKTVSGGIVTCSGKKKKPRKRTLPKKAGMPGNPYSGTMPVNQPKFTPKEAVHSNGKMLGFSENLHFAEYGTNS